MPVDATPKRMKVLMCHGDGDARRYISMGFPVVEEFTPEGAQGPLAILSGPPLMAGPFDNAQEAFTALLKLGHEHEEENDGESEE